MIAGPLAGCGVLITRPAHQSGNLAAAIKAAGGRVVRFPVLQIVGRDIDDIRQDLAALPSPDIVIFISSNAVTHGFAALGATTAKLAAIGPATRDAIEAMGRTVRLFPERDFDSEHLLQHAALQELDKQNILIVRGQDGRDLLADTLRERGANVAYVCAYRREACAPSAAEVAALEAELREGSVHFSTVMSVATMQELLRILPRRSWPDLRQTVLVAPSARVLQTATALLPGISSVLAAGPQPPAIVNALIGQWQNGHNS